MEKSLQEVLRENKENIKRVRIEAYKKQQKKEAAKTYLLIAIVLGLVAGLIVIGSKQYNNSIERCAQNHDYNYCVANS